MGGVRLEDAERAFKEWPREKDAGGPRLIPEPLWRKAVALARARGVSETAQRLRLNHGELTVGEATRRDSEFMVSRC